MTALSPSRAALVLAAIVGAQACAGLPESSSRTNKGGPDRGAGAPDVTFNAATVGAYLRQLAPYLVSRELEAEELAALDGDAVAAVRPMLTAWTKEPDFARSARRLVSRKLSVSGSRDGVDFDLPGNLAEYVVRSDLPFSTVLTASYCVDAQGAKRACDTGAPFEAGVLGTRAFMMSRASRFNLTRASTMLKTFACESYPMKEQLQPRIQRGRLIPMFQTDKEDDSMKTFGNGSACFQCHGQFGPHAQLFVRFDESGLYRTNATGAQDPDGELGRAKDGLFASHLAAPEEAKEEKSQFFGRDVANLKEAAKVLAESPTFAPCQVRNLLEYALRVTAENAVASEVVSEIADKARASGDPTFASLAIETFAHPRIMASVVRGLSGANAPLNGANAPAAGEPNAGEGAP